MGAIAAVLATEGEPDAGGVRRMLAAAPHRGTATEVFTLGRCALGISNSPRMHDASVAEEAGLAAAFVGVLDNLVDLLRMHPREGRDAAGTTPAAILLDLFRTLGDDAPSLLRGQFAAVLTDGTRLWCMRDHFAAMHLFYRAQPGAFVVASEPKQVVSGAGIAREPDLDVLEQLLYGFVDFGDLDRELPCALKGVRRLPKATTVRVEGERLVEHRFWDPEPLLETASLSPEEIKHRFDELMTQAVARTMSGADVISLSGGIDSPAVAAYAVEIARERGGALGALTSIYPDFPAVDESAYVEIVSRELGLPLHTYEPSARPLDGIDEWVRLCDGPTPVLPPGQAEEHYRHARELGYTTMLTGEQAELVFDRRGHLLAHLLRRGRLRAFLRIAGDQRTRGHSFTRLAREIASGTLPRPIVAGYQRHRRSDGGMGIPPWLDAQFVQAGHARYVVPAGRRWKEEQLGLAVGPGIGFEADEISQAVCGVRLRRSWADVDLFEFFLSLPAEVKFPRYGGKALVRSLLRGRVPDAILDRTDKTYFNSHFMSRIDYDTFKRLLVNPTHQIKGVRYDVLADRLDSADLSLAEYKWALDLAKTHAFLGLW